MSIASTTIKVNPFDYKSIAKAEKEVKAYEHWIEEKLNLMMDVIAKYGEDGAINRVKYIDTGETLNSIHGYSYYSATVGSKHLKEAVVVAGGAAVWIEFGTGVYANPVYRRPEHVPGIVDPGNYGKHNGRYPCWYYPTDREDLALRDSKGNPVVLKDGKYLARSWGMPQNMFMYDTLQDIRKKVGVFAREAFK